MLHTGIDRLYFTFFFDFFLYSGCGLCLSHLPSIFNTAVEQFLVARYFHSKYLYIQFSVHVRANSVACLITKLFGGQFFLPYFVSFSITFCSCTDSFNCNTFTSLACKSKNQLCYMSYHRTSFDVFFFVCVLGSRNLSSSNIGLFGLAV